MVEGRARSAPATVAPSRRASSRSSSAWAWARFESGCPESIREISTTRSAPETASAAVVDPAGLLDLAHRDVVVGERRHLGQVGDHQHLAVAGHLPERPGQGQGGRPADARVDLVEHHRRRAPGRHQPQGEHGAGQLPARGGLGQRPEPPRRRWRRAGRSRASPAPDASTSHLEAGPGHGQVAEPRRRWPRPGSGAAVAPGGEERPLRRAPAPPRTARALRPRGRPPPPRPARAARAARGPPSANSDDGGAIAPVLAVQVGEQPTPGLDRLQAVAGRPPRSRRRSGARSRCRPTSAWAARSRSLQLGERRADRRGPPAAAPSRSSAPGRRAVGVERRQRRGRRARGARPGRPGVPPRPASRAVLVGIVEAGARRSRRSGGASTSAPGPARARHRRARPVPAPSSASRWRSSSTGLRRRCRRTRRGRGVGPRCAAAPGGRPARGCRRGSAASSASAPSGAMRPSIQHRERPGDGDRPGRTVSSPPVVEEPGLDHRLARPRPGPARDRPAGRARAAAPRPASVLPAPVSPVSAVMPGPNSTVRSSITPSWRTRSSASMRRFSGRVRRRGCCAAASRTPGGRA